MELHRKYRCVSEKMEQSIRKSIYRGELLPGEKLCSEGQLARKFAISKSTVHKVLDVLAAEGLIIKVRGSGSFVADKCPEMRLHSSSPDIRKRQILFLSFSTIFSEETLKKYCFNQIFDGLGRVLNAYRYNLLINHVDNSWTPPACLVNGDVGGIVFHGHVKREFWDKYMAHLPCVGLQVPDPGLDCSWVCLNSYERSYLAVEYLYSLGHRKIAFFTRGCEPDSMEEERLWGFRKAMRKKGLSFPEEYCIIAPSIRVNGERRPEKDVPDLREYLNIFNTPDRPTALLVQGWVVPVITALQKFGLKVPEDVSVISGIGCLPPDDSYTVINDRFEDICAEAGHLIVEIMENSRSTEKKTILVSPQLCVGRTAGKLKPITIDKQSNP